MRRVNQMNQDFVKEVHRMYESIHKVPLHIASTHLVLGIAMLLLSLFGGGNLPLTYGAITALVLTSLLKCIIFSYLLFKSSPAPECFGNLLQSCLTARPYLTLAFGFSPVLICIFLISGIVGAITLTHIPHHNAQKDTTPAVYSIGMGLIFCLAEVLPMRVHYGLIRQISLVQELTALILPTRTSTSAAQDQQFRDIETFACSVQDPAGLRASVGVLDCFCCGTPPNCRTVERCEVLTYISDNQMLNPPPPPPYSMETQCFTVDSRLSKDEGNDASQLSTLITCNEFLKSEAERPPAYTFVPEKKFTCCSDKSDVIYHI